VQCPVGVRARPWPGPAVAFGVKADINFHFSPSSLPARLLYARRAHAGRKLDLASSSSSKKEGQI
jgi:hypothetical protein